MFSKKEILFWIVALIVGVFMAWSCRLQAMDIQKLEEPVKIARAIYGNAITANEGLPSNPDRTYCNDIN